MIELLLQLTHPGFSLDVDLNLPVRGVSAIFGPSGSGKTSLLRVVAGLERRAMGKLQIGDEVWQDSNAGIFMPPHRRALGMVFQDAALFPHLTVRENLLFGLRRMGQKSLPQILEQAPVVELLGIGNLLERRPEKLSGGEQQRVAIARALFAQPQLLLMDEPLAALDEQRKSEFLPWLERLHDELDIPVLYVSHSLTEVARLADHLVLLDKGRVQASGTPEELLPRLDLPLSHGEEAFVMVEAQVIDYDDTYALAHLDFAGQSLWAASPPREPGTRVRVRIQARDVSLALTPQHDTSILNTLSARIVHLESQPPGRVLVQLDVGGKGLLVRLTQKSTDHLQLAEGKQIYAQVKSVALLD